MQRSALTIRTWADAQRLNPYRRDRERRGISAIKLDIPSLPASDVAAKEKELNRLYFACGCSEATAFGLTALIGMGIWLASRPGGWDDLAWIDIGYVVGGFFAATGVGKFVGRLRARRALQSALDDLHPHFKDRKPPVSMDSARCGVV